MDWESPVDAISVQLYLTPSNPTTVNHASLLAAFRKINFILISATRYGRDWFLEVIPDTSSVPSCITVDGTECSLRLAKPKGILFRVFPVMSSVTDAILSEALHHWGYAGVSSIRFLETSGVRNMAVTFFAETGPEKISFIIHGRMVHVAPQRKPASKNKPSPKPSSSSAVPLSPTSIPNVVAAEQAHHPKVNVPIAPSELLPRPVQPPSPPQSPTAQVDSVAKVDMPSSRPPSDKRFMVTHYDRPSTSTPTKTKTTVPPADPSQPDKPAVQDQQVSSRLEPSALLPSSASLLRHPLSSRRLISAVT